VKTLVFGSGGYIGTYLVDALRSRGYEVVAESSRLDGAALDPLLGCLRIGYTFPKEIDVVFYLSQSPRYRDLPESIEHVMAVNCFAAYRLARLASQAGVKRFIYASTGTVYEPSFLPLGEDARLCCDNLYAISKIAAERALERCSQEIHTCCARLFGVYGPAQPLKMVENFCQRMTSGQKIFLEYDPKVGEHSGIRLSLTYVADVVSGLIALAEMDEFPKIVNLAGLEETSIRELVGALASRLEVNPTLEFLDRHIRGYYVADSSFIRRSISLNDTSLEIGLDHCVAEFTRDG
jgi:nucleoside-diphosphate-sugar epimerase